MIVAIKKGLFRIEVPLPKNPLKSLNSYLIRGEDRNLIVDTGLNRKECLEAMREGLRELDVDLKRTDLFITHFHTDHFGLVGELATESSRVYFNRPESNLMLNWGGWERMLEYGALNGFPRQELQAALNQHPGHKFSPGSIPELSMLDEGDSIRIGDFNFSCISTPGHSPGHICLYEREKRFLISGDHVLGDITPNIQCWSDSQNPLEDYLENLNKVRSLDIELMLPGHRSLITEPIKRVDEIKTHHRKRLDEVLAIVGQGAAQAYQVASQMQWDIEAESWEQFPLMQKWFATGEAIAHLRCLEERKIVSRKKGSAEIEYALADSQKS